MKVHNDQSMSISTTEKGEQKSRSIYVNYMQLMVDAARDKNLWDELFSSNERRIYYLNEKVGMAIPAGITVHFDIGSVHVPQLFMKDQDGIIRVSEGAELFKVIEKLNNGEDITQMMAIKESSEIGMTVHEKLEESDTVLSMTFFDPSRDTTLFVLEYDDKEIILTTCLP